MQRKINPLVKWWMTPKLPYEDIYGLPLLKNKDKVSIRRHLFSQWIKHPIRRRLARLYVRFLQKHYGLIVIGVTGSAGKSSTVEALKKILNSKGNTVATPHSIDPVYNIPNTILRSTLKTKYLILEMSVEYVGEMDYYIWLVNPNIGVVTNVFKTHALHLVDENGVAKEKGKLIQSLSKSGYAVLNKDNKYVKKMSKLTKAKITYFNEDENPIQTNLNAASAVCRLLGFTDEEIEKSLKDYKLPDHRFKLIKHKSGAYIFDDTYNSNPGAFIKTLNYFAKLAGKNNKIAVVGDMLELGDKEVDEHLKISKELKKLGFTKVFGVGKLVSHITKNVYTDPVAVFPALKSYLKKGNYIFIKGSRSIGLDKLVDKLLSL